MDYKLHNESTKRSVNPYTDNYTGFIWNGRHSSDFNCFIENTGHLTFEPAPDFSNSTVSPAFYDGALYTGTQTQSKRIQLNLVFYHVTLKNFNDALKWLDRKVVSSFLLDYEPEWRYQCKLSSVGVTEKYVDGYCIDQSHGSYKKQDLYICRMQVVFETVDIHNALSTYTQIQRSIEDGQVTHTFNIINPASLPMYFRIHLFDFTVKDIIIYQVIDEDKIPICAVNLNLDDQQPISLHYDSKTGAVTLANRLIQSLHISNGNLLCSYCATLSSISVPFGDMIQLEIPDYDGQVLIEYDYQTDVI